jgi:hypothetical protein
LESEERRELHYIANGSSNYLNLDYFYDQLVEQQLDRVRHDDQLINSKTATTQANTIQS